MARRKAGRAAGTAGKSASAARRTGKAAGKTAAKRAKKAARKTTRKRAKKTAKKAANSKPARRKTAPKRKKPPAAKAAADPAAPGEYATAESMAGHQQSISVSEFFAKNRHLLGFDNPRKALLTTVREAVDNALDACEEAGILPKIDIGIEQLSETHFRVWVQDNGPGIVRRQIPHIFGRLLYGSKFHRLRMSRGQQGIGISAAGMYGLITTGRPVRIVSRTSPRAAAHCYELQIDTKSNRPDIIRDERVDWKPHHGTRVDIELEARYQRGRRGVDDYLAQTAIANPHVALSYHAPDGRHEEYTASTKALPPTPKSIRPHPHGVELGVLLKMLGETRARAIQKFLTSEFSRVSPRVAREIIERACLGNKKRPKSMNGDDARRIHRAIRDTRIMAPSTDCVIPIGAEKLVKGLRRVVDAAFYVAGTRSPAVYRGNPFIIEAAVAYGKKDGTGAPGAAPDAPAGKKNDAAEPPAQLARLIRFANRVPLQYQQSACAIYKSVVGLNWKSYGLAQARGALPTGPLTIVVHMASVWVPFTSESKEAIASYPEILKEIRLALQECGRKLATHIRKVVRVRREMQKRSYIEQYIPAIGEALRDILDLKDRQVTRLCGSLRDVLERSRKF